MMNSTSTSTHKIVVGIGLAAVFGVGVSVFAVRASHESDLARSAPAAALVPPADQNPADAPAPAPTPAQGPAVQTPTDSDLAKDTVVIPAGDDSKPATPKATSRADRQVARTRNGGDTAGTRVASAADSNTSRAHQSAPNGSDGADTDIAPAPTAATSDAPGVSDSQITADVRSEIATAAPDSNVDVTTRNGIVALAGSVPNQDAVDQARQAAQRVAGVRQVDASALMVSNQ